LTAICSCPNLGQIDIAHLFAIRDWYFFRSFLAQAFLEKPLLLLSCVSNMVSHISGATPVKRLRLSGKMSPFYSGLLEDLGAEQVDATQMIYLVTSSRVLPGVAAAGGYRDLATVTRAEFAEMIRDAFDNPVVLGSSGGRPRTTDSPMVLVVVVAKEAHADGSPHLHAVVKLSRNMRFKTAKSTLEQRHKLASHWSCTHTQLWSAIRYLHIATPRKPTVDGAPHQWTHDGRVLDLTACAQEPFTAVAWRMRREKAEAKAIVDERPAPSFNKLDFNSLVISKHLHTKASLLAYVQKYASPAAKLYVAKQQRRLVEHIEDAHEWAEAPAAAGLEKISDWEMLCQAGGAACPHAPGECSYAKAAEEIFRVNAGTLCQRQLASNLKHILQNGPRKTCRVPMLVGPSNTGKSTLLYPFDDLFGPKNIFHKPALGSTFALRNIVQKKRFIFWDDYRPVEFAQDLKTMVRLTRNRLTRDLTQQVLAQNGSNANGSRGIRFKTVLVQDGSGSRWFG
jgi:hypothetical protein